MNDYQFDALMDTLKAIHAEIAAMSENDLSDEAFDLFEGEMVTDLVPVNRRPYQAWQECRRRAEILIAAADEQGFLRGCAKGVEADKGFERVLEKHGREYFEAGWIKCNPNALPGDGEKAYRAYQQERNKENEPRA